MAASEAIQTISRLTPLTDVLLLIDAEVKPVTPRTIDVSVAAGRALASDAMAPARPASSLALQDGWALNSDETLGAGGYAPAPLARMPPRVEAGQAMPAGTDSIAPIDAVKVAGGVAEVLMPINPGEGVLAAGGDSDPAIPLRRTGERLTATDVAAFAAAGIARVTVREPRFRVLPLRGSGIITAAARLVCTDIERHGGAARFDDSGRGLGVAMAAESADAIIAIGGTGSGRNDNAVQVLAREGRLAVHGVALTPGETAAVGFVGATPVLLLPGRLDAALAVWLLVGRRILDRLAAAKNNDGEIDGSIAARAEGCFDHRIGRGRSSAPQCGTGGAAGEQISSALVAGAFRRLDFGAARQRGISCRLAGPGEIVAVSHSS